MMRGVYAPSTEGYARMNACVTESKAVNRKSGHPKKGLSAGEGIFARPGTTSSLV